MRPAAALPLVSLPPPCPAGDPGPAAPAGVVLTIPDEVRALAAVWHAANLEVAAGRAGAAVQVLALPLASLNAYGLPGTRTGLLLEDVLGTEGTAAAAARHYADAATAAVAAADAIDRLGQNFAAPGATTPVGTGQSAPATLLSNFARVDTAVVGGDADGIVSLADLRAAAADVRLAPALRAAAQQLIDEPALFGLVEALDHDGTGGVRDRTIDASALREFLELRRHTEALYSALPELIALSDNSSELVTSSGLRTAVRDPTLTPQVREAAQWLLDHQQAWGVLARGDRPTSYYEEPISRESILRLLIDGRAFDGRPADARRFVQSLPLPRDGGRGLPLGLVSDQAVQTLANAALTAANGDLSEQVSIIAHLPETDGGVRNALISAMYAKMGTELDRVGERSAGGQTGACGAQRRELDGHRPLGLQRRAGADHR